MWQALAQSLPQYPFKNPFPNVPGLRFEGSSDATSPRRNAVSAVLYSFSKSRGIVDVTLEFAAEK
jgi:hypothetical protein